MTHFGLTPTYWPNRRCSLRWLTPVRLASWAVFALPAVLAACSEGKSQEQRRPPPLVEAVSEVPPELVGVNLDPAQELLVKVAATKWGAWLMAAIVACRFLVKPAFSYLHYRASQTPELDDDRRLEAIERSRWFAIVSYLLDTVFSVKLQQPKQ